MVEREGKRKWGREQECVKEREEFSLEMRKSRKQEEPRGESTRQRHAYANVSAEMTRERESERETIKIMAELSCDIPPEK